jgi:hypothetical protein
VQGRRRRRRWGGPACPARRPERRTRCRGFVRRVVAVHGQAPRPQAFASNTTGSVRAPGRRSLWRTRSRLPAGTRFPFSSNTYPPSTASGCASAEWRTRSLRMTGYQPLSTPARTYGATLSAGVTPSPNGTSRSARTSLVSSSVGTSATCGTRADVCRMNVGTSRSATTLRRSARVTCRMRTRACLMARTQRSHHQVPMVVEVPDARLRPRDGMGDPDVLCRRCSRARASRPPRSMPVDAGRFLV